MSTSSGASAPLWLKVFIALGVLVAIYLMAAPFMFRELEKKEEQRFSGCKAGQRVDCEPSLFWERNGWSLSR